MKKTVFFFLFIIGFNAEIFPQASNDAGLWGTFNLEKKVKHNVSFFLTEEYRLKENFTQTNLFYTDFGAAVRLYKFLKVSLAYRVIEKNLVDNTFSFRHRLMLDSVLKKKVGSFGLSYRQRICRNGIHETNLKLNTILVTGLLLTLQLSFATKFTIQETWNRIKDGIGVAIFVE